jgi:hypothetical protein
VEVDGTASGRRSELPLAEGILAFTGSILPQLIASLSFSSLLLSSFFRSNRTSVLLTDSIGVRDQRDSGCLWQLRA